MQDRQVVFAGIGRMSRMGPILSTEFQPMAGSKPGSSSVGHVDRANCQWYRRANLRGSPQKADGNVVNERKIVYIVKQSGFGAEPSLASGQHLLGPARVFAGLRRPCSSCFV